jgi:D-alanyl-D-alanine carboxypeptidase
LFKKAVVIFILLFALPKDASALSAKGYALVEQTTGRLIEGCNINMKLPMASTTKIMTGLLACESTMLDRTFTVPAEAIRVEGSSVGLVAGEKLTLQELTYGLLLESGNDAANTIAFILAGSLPDFASTMNAKAQDLGLRNTHFTNPSGLDNPAHYTTALDLARLGAAAMRNPEFRRIASTYRARIPYDGIKDGRLLRNHNELLKMYAGTIGIKTGYTRRSGRCLVSCAERAGVTLVAATLNGRDDWNDHMALLNGGFGKMSRYCLLPVGAKITSHIVGGDADHVVCSCRDIPEAVLTPDEVSRVEMRLLMRKFIYAPVTKGQKLGEIEFRLGDTVLARTDLVAEETVAQEKPNKFKDFWLSIF